MVPLLLLLTNRSNSRAIRAVFMVMPRIMRYTGMDSCAVLAEGWTNGGTLRICRMSRRIRNSIKIMFNVVYWPNSQKMKKKATTSTLVQHVLETGHKITSTRDVANIRHTSKGIIREVPNLRILLTSAINEISAASNVRSDALDFSTTATLA